MEKKNWYRILSPCTLASAFAVVAILYALISFENSGGWSMIIAIIAMPFLFVFLVADAIAKYMIINTALLWVVELVIIAIAFLIYKTHIFI